MAQISTTYGPGTVNTLTQAPGVQMPGGGGPPDLSGVMAWRQGMAERELAMREKAAKDAARQQQLQLRALQEEQQHQRFQQSRAESKARQDEARARMPKRVPRASKFVKLTTIGGSTFYQPANRGEPGAVASYAGDWDAPDEPVTPQGGAALMDPRAEAQAEAIRKDASAEDFERFKKATQW